MRDFLREVFWLLVSFGLWAAAFHPLDLWPLAWVAMVPAFVRLVAGGTGRRRLGLAWIVSQYWLHAALMGWTGVIAPPLAFLVPMLGIPFSWLTGFLLDRGVVRLRLPLVFAAPLTIVCVEVLRDQALLGLSWASIGYSQWRWLDLLRLASAGRVHLMSLVVLTVNAGIAAAIVRWRAGASWPARLRPVLAAGLVLAAGVAGGRLLAPGPQEPGPLAAGLQPNIPQRERMRGHRDPRQAMFGILCIHEQLLRDLRPLEPDLLVWSETAFCPVNEPAEPLAYLLDGSFGDPEAPGGRRPMRDLVLQGPDQVTILGSIRRTELPPSEKGGPLDDDDDGLDERNVAWVVRGGRATDVVYDKRGLAPFGEYIPLPRGWPGRDLVKSMIRQAVHYVPDLNVGKRCRPVRGAFAVRPEKGGAHDLLRGGVSVVLPRICPAWRRLPREHQQRRVVRRLVRARPGGRGRDLSGCRDGAGALPGLELGHQHADRAREASASRWSRTGAAGAPRCGDPSTAGSQLRTAKPATSDGGIPPGFSRRQRS